MKVSFLSLFFAFPNRFCKRFFHIDVEASLWNNIIPNLKGKGLVVLEFNQKSGHLVVTQHGLHLSEQATTIERTK